MICQVYYRQCKSCDEQPLPRIQKAQTGNMHDRSRAEASTSAAPTTPGAWWSVQPQLGAARRIHHPRSVWGLQLLEPNLLGPLQAANNASPDPTYDNRVNALAQALKQTRVQTLNNPCTIGGFYAASAAVGAAGAFSPPAVMAIVENPLTTAHSFLTNLMRQVATGAPGLGIMIKGSIASAKYIYSQCYQ